MSPNEVKKHMTPSERQELEAITSAFRDLTDKYIAAMKASDGEQTEYTRKNNKLQHELMARHDRVVSFVIKRSTC